MTDAFAPPAGPVSSAGSQRAEDRVPKDGKGRYLLPDPYTGIVRPWRRVTTLAAALDDSFGLTRWKERQVARGVSLRPDLVTLAKSVGDPDTEQGKATLGDVAKQAHAAAGSSKGRNLGTALHNATERLDRGETHEQIGLPHPYAHDLMVYDRFKKANGITAEPSHIERICVWPELEVAGQLDRALLWRASRKIVDLKTGQDADEHGQLKLTVQLTCYARAPFWWNFETQSYDAAPELDQHEGAMIHLPSAGGGKIGIFRVNLDAGYIAAQVAYQVLAMRSQQKALVAPYENVQYNPLDALAVAARRDPGYPGNVQAAPAPLASTPQRTIEQQIDAAFPLGAAPGAEQRVAALPNGTLPAGCCGGWAGPNGEQQRCDPCPTPGVSANVPPAAPTSIVAGTAPGIPEAVAAAILAARTEDALVQLYQQGTAAGMWTDAMTELGQAVKAAYITPCPATPESGNPHGDTIACGCGYRRPDALPTAA